MYLCLKVKFECICKNLDGKVSVYLLGCRGDKQSFKVLNIFSVFSNTQRNLFLHAHFLLLMFISKCYSIQSCKFELPFTGISFYFVCLPLPLNFYITPSRPQFLVLRLLASTSLFCERSCRPPGLYRSRHRSLSLTECNTTHSP